MGGKTREAVRVTQRGGGEAVRLNSLSSKAWWGGRERGVPPPSQTHPLLIISGFSTYQLLASPETFRAGLVRSRVLIPK